MVQVPRLSKFLMKHHHDPRIIFAMRSSAAMLTVLFLACVFAFAQDNSYPKPQVSSAIGQIAPNFALKDQDGKDFKLSEQRGHWVLLFFYRGYW